ncbi:MAG TPA: hypothetical protein VH763_17315 [Gemmatimonadales bacterium]
MWGLPSIPGIAPQRDRQVPLARASETAGRVAPIPSGTSIPVTLDQDVPVDRDRFGDSFKAHVTRDVVVNGKVAVTQGAPAEVKLMPSDEKANSATLKLSKLEVGGQLRDVNSSSARADAGEKLNTGKKTAIGAAAGAVVGAVTGAGVIKGAVVGAGGGLAWGLLTHGDTRVADDTHLKFQLEKDVS